MLMRVTRRVKKNRKIIWKSLGGGSCAGDKQVSDGAIAPSHPALAQPLRFHLHYPRDLCSSCFAGYCLIGYCESTDVISRHHPDLNLKYQTCLIWSGWPRFVYEQIGRCKVRSVNASHYQIIRAEHRDRSRCSTRFFLRFSGGGNRG